MNRTTAITPNQLADLVDSVRNADPGGEWAKRLLGLHSQVHLTITYLRTNLTEAFLADIHGVSQPTISRIQKS